MLTNTAHIHKQPPPPATGVRRTIFIALETLDTKCDPEVVFAHNYKTVFAGDLTRKKVGKRHRQPSKGHSRETKKTKM